MIYKRIGSAPRESLATYLDRAQAQADAEAAAGGRFKKETATNVTGVPTYPALPASSPWSRDPVGPEPALGIDVNAMEPIGTGPEIERSIQELSEPACRAPVGNVPPTTVETVVGSLIPTTIRRR